MIRLSPSKIACLDTCPRKYHYRYIEGWKEVKTPAALPFGNAIHSAWEAHLKGIASGQEVNHIQAFQAEFDAKLKVPGIKFKENITIEEMEAMGLAIVEAIPSAWEKTGLRPLVTATGDPIVEYSLETTLAEGVRIMAILDVAAVNEDASTTVLDFKTADSPADEIFVVASEQLAIQQLVLEANAEKLGLIPPGKLGFMEIIKKKVPKVEMKKNGEPKKIRGEGPTIHAPVTIPVHPPEVMNEFREKWTQDAAQIARGYFPKRPLMAFNTPCKMCEFRNLCMRGDSTGLVQRPYQSPALKSVA